jgi:hypothetical protein
MEKGPDMSRRNFLRSAAAVGATAMSGEALAQTASEAQRLANIENGLKELEKMDALSNQIKKDGSGVIAITQESLRQLRLDGIKPQDTTQLFNATVSKATEIGAAQTKAIAHLRTGLQAHADMLKAIGNRARTQDDLLDIEASYKVDIAPFLGTIERSEYQLQSLAYTSKQRELLEKRGPLVRKIISLGERLNARY